MADITSITLPAGLDTAGINGAQAHKLKSYLYQLTEQLRYVLSNLDADNMSASYNAGVGGAAVKVAELTEKQQQDFDALRQKLVETATQIAHDYKATVTAANDSLRTEVTEGYTAKSESAAASMEALLDSRVSQTSRSLNISLSEVSSLTRQTADALETLSSQTDTWFRFTAAGLEIGKSTGGEASPYTLRMDSEKLSFLRCGAEVASLRYNRLYVTAAEISDRLSIGGSAGEGFYDFITTATGLGVKWRAN